MPRLMCFRGLGIIPQTNRSPVRFPVRAHASVVGQVPGWGHERGNWSMFLSLSFSLPLPLSKNKEIKSLKNNKTKWLLMLLYIHLYKINVYYAAQNDHCLYALYVLTYLHIFQESGLFLLFLRPTLEGQILENCISLEKQT